MTVTDHETTTDVGDLSALLVLAGTFAAGYGVLFTLVGDYRDEYGLSETMLGIILGVGFIVAFISQTLLGPLGDRGHARVLMAAGAAANVAGLLLMGFGTTAGVILAGRVLSGLAIGAALPAVRRVLVVGSGSDLGRNLGWLFSIEVFGFAMGPVVSALVAGRFGLAAPFIVVAAANGLSGLYVLRRVDVAEGDGADGSTFAFDLLRDRGFAGAVILGSAAFVMIGAFDALWDIVHTDLDTPEWMANVGITLFALPLVLLGPFAGKLAQRVGPFLVSAAGLVAAAVFMGIYGVMSSGSAIFGFTMGHAITDGLSFAAAGIAVGLVAPENRQAGAQGVLGGMQALAAGLIAPVTGYVYEHNGQQAAYWLAAAVVLAMAIGGLWIAGSIRSIRGSDIESSNGEAVATAL